MLVSPGVEVTIIDESFYNSSGQGTIPLIVIATASNKASPTAGVGIAPFTVPSLAGRLVLATSQRDLIQNFGYPFFNSNQGTPMHGDEVNEYGLWAAYSYLGIANQAYILRADIDLAQLLPSPGGHPPVGSPVSGTYWLDLSQTRWGVFRSNGSTSPGSAWKPVAVTLASVSDVDNSDVPKTSFGTNGDITVVVSAASNYFYEKLSGQWYKIGSSGWVTAHGNAVTVTRTSSPAYPAGPVAGSLWVKGNPANKGALWSVKFFNGTIGQWTTLTAPFIQYDSTKVDGDVTKDTAAIAAIPNPSAGTVYVGFDVVTGDQRIRRWSGTQWQDLVYEESSDQPNTTPPDGTHWYNTLLRADIMYGTGENWMGYCHQFPFTDPNGPQISGSAPFFQSDGTSPLVEGDLWIDSSDVEHYPMIHRWDATDQIWLLMDNTDQTTPFGIVFGDARSDSGISFTGIANGGTYVFNSTASVDMGLSDFVDPDAPDPTHHPAGLLLFNTRYSSFNIKQWKTAWFAAGGFDPTTDYTTTEYQVGNPRYMFPAVSSSGTWKTASGNSNDGSPFMGRKAQRQMVVVALSAAVTANQDIRSEVIFYNLMTAPGYPELIQEFFTLNSDMNFTAFCIGDTPIRLLPTGTAIQTWATNGNNIASNDEDGLTLADKYTGLYYPWGMGINIDGNSVMIPPSAIALTTIAYNDQVAYPWYAPAGFNRGLVTNAGSVGYLSSEGEYVPTILNAGQRDVLYTNRINPIAYIPNRGLVVYGQKTLSPVSTAMDRINVARLANYIVYHLDLIMKPYLFEQNTLATRASVKNTVDRLFSSLVLLNGVYDFAVVCDKTNNTPDRIDRNELWVDCAIQPVKTLEFIYVPVRILNTQATSVG